MKNKNLGHALAAVTAVFLFGCGGGGGTGGGGQSGSGGSGGTGTSGTNTPPTINGSPEVTQLRAGDSYSFTPEASDADGDPLTFSIENAPDWVLFNQSTGEVSGTPTSTDLGDYADIVVSVSDGQATAHLDALSLMVLPARLGESNFTPKGSIVSTADGYQSIGDLVLDNGNFVQEFIDADMTLSFNNDGELIDLQGETNVPFMLPAAGGGIIMAEAEVPVRATVGLMTGAEINADETFGIKLLDDNQYLVYYIGGGMTLNFMNAEDPNQDRTVVVEPPVGSEWLLITDINDPFYYYYAHIPLLPLVPAYGEGRSFNGLIPFEPLIDFEGLDSFNGTYIENGIFTIGKKIFDFYEISGTRVLKQSTILDIDWADPLNSDYEFRAGMNGEGAIIFSVLGVGLFRMDHSKVSATLDVGLDRQHMAMVQVIAPDVSWQPDWFHILPTAETRAEWSIDGSGEFHVSLASSFESLIPVGDLAGEVTLSNEAASFTGMTTAAGEPLSVSLEFSNEQTVGRVGFPESYARSINDDVAAALDEEIREVEETIAELEETLAQIGELEINLNNIRRAIPGLVDGALSKLNAAPDNVYRTVYDAVIDKFKSSCTKVLTQTRCAHQHADEHYYANDAASKAKTGVALRLPFFNALLVSLKVSAEAADDAELREGLRQALLTVYDNREVVVEVEFSHTVEVGVNTPLGFVGKKVPVEYSTTQRRTIVDAAMANRIKAAADNIHLLQETGGIAINLQDVVDQLPTRDVLDQVKAEVQAGTRAVPIPEGLGYRAAGNSYTPFVTIDGEDHDVDFNVLSPSDVREGVSELLGELLLP